jgi:hypothetical protein
LSPFIAKSPESRLHPQSLLPYLQELHGRCSR